ncbi:ion transport peptide isoform X2 [Fopius arisanus]|uniref:Ion transport peptide isoform X2 n=1 Tax=Fopius arisanus TaxID=64838 RepID=A0A9R1TJ52_9HYME|nr:PREDICTED: ion transport peptide isoform X2 [Fopius arisanus]
MCWDTFWLFVLNVRMIVIVGHKMMQRESRQSSIAVSTLCRQSLNDGTTSLRSRGSGASGPVVPSATPKWLNHSSSSSSSTCPPVLLSVLAWSVTLLLISSCLGIADAGVLMGHPLGKRSFMELQCKGIYDKSIFARLDRICEDCYNLFREPQLHTLCRQDCFQTKYFTSCIQALLLEDEKEKFLEMVEYLGRKK